MRREIWLDCLSGLELHNYELREQLPRQTNLSLGCAIYQILFRHMRALDAILEVGDNATVDRHDCCTCPGDNVY